MADDSTDLGTDLTDSGSEAADTPASTSNCSCWANSRADEERCEESDTGSTTAGCFTFLNEDGSYKCHWGPEEIYSCWDEGWE